jgi:hypothetical protein
MSKRFTRIILIWSLVILIWAPFSFADTVLPDSVFGLLMIRGFPDSSWWWADIKDSLQFNIISAGKDNAGMDSTVVNTAGSLGLKCVQTRSSKVNGAYQEVPTSRYALAYEVFECGDDPIPGYFGLKHHYPDGYSDSVSGRKVWVAPRRYPPPDTITQMVVTGPRYHIFRRKDYTGIYTLAIDSVLNNGDSIGYILSEIENDTMPPWQVIPLYDDETYFTEDSEFVDISIAARFDTTLWTRKGYEFKIYSTGVREMYVDELFVYHDDAKDLMDQDTTVIREIQEQVTEWANNNTVFGYYTHDEPHHWHFGPIGYINQLVQDTLSAMGDTTKHLYNAIFRDLDEYLELTGINFIMLDPYPLGPKQGIKYYGEDSLGLQTLLNSWINGLTEKVNIVRDREVDDVYLTLQAFSWDETSDRLITASELRCFAGMGLCEKLDGFSVFAYYLPNNHTLWDPETGYTDLYYSLKDEIVPFIKGIEQTYISLSLDTTYYIKLGSVNPPSGSLIDSVTYYTDTSETPNPDAGWFQVAEFRDKEENDYLLIVNRACNYDSQTVTPDVFATIYLNTAEFPAYQYQVTNVDTNKTEQMMIKREDGTLRFSTLLEAGEAKLFKLQGIPIKY